MASIANLSVSLTASIGGFAANMATAAKTLGGIRGAYASATDSAAAFERMQANVGQVKLAGAETIQALQTTLAVARSELRKFAGNHDVQVAIEIGREYVDEAWIKARSSLQRLAERSGLSVGISVVADKTQDVRGWIARQRTALTKPITVRLELMKRAVDNQVAGVRKKLDGLKQYRAVRIGIAAVNATKAPIAAAMATLGPVRRIATSGIKVALSASHAGIAFGVKKAQALFGQLATAGKGLASMLFSSFTLISAGLAGVVAGGSLVMMTKQSMAAIDVNAKLADRLGTTTEGLVGLQYAGDLAGVSNEQLTGGLEKMLKSLGGAADDSELASNAFTKLSLNAAELAKMPADQAFTVIAQKISEIQNPAERATAAMQIFGKSGQELLPLMTSGAEGIKAAQEEAAKLGLTYSRVDAAKVEQANDAITRMSSIFTGISNQLAIGLAPYIEAAATKFVELATAGGGIGPIIGGAIEWIATGIASLSDWLQLLPAGFHGFRAGALEAIAGVLGAIDNLGGGIVQLLNLLPGVKVSWTDTFSTLQQGMEQIAAEEAGKMNDALGRFQRGDNAAAVAKTFDDIRAKSTAAAKTTADNATKMRGAFQGLEDSTANLQKVATTLADIQKQVSQFGLSEAQAKAADLSALGATPEQIAQARQLLDLKAQLENLNTLDTGDPLTTFAAKMEQLQKLYAQGKVTAEQFGALRDTASKSLNDKLTESAKQVTESVRTPLEKYQEEMDRLNELLTRGLITQDTFDRASVQAGNALSGDKAAAPAAFQSGSAEAQRFAYDNARGMQKLTKDDVPKSQLAEAKDGNRLLEQIVRNTKATEVQTVEI